VSEIEASRYKINPLFRISDRIHLNNHIVHLVSFDRSVGVELGRHICFYGDACSSSQARRVCLSLEVKYDPASRLKCTATLIIDEIQYSRKSCHDEQFLSRFLVANYIFITRNYNT
jgi:hypothetical protein